MNKLTAFFQNKKLFPAFVGFASGLYPIIFYYSNNFSLINSWRHLGFFICLFLFVPMVACYLGFRIFNMEMFKRVKKFLLPFLSVSFFLVFLEISLFASLKVWLTLGIIVIAVIAAILLHRHLKKIMIIQFILAFLGLFTLVPTLIKQFSYSDEWMVQPDNIEEGVFKKKPNVYFIQPDGYVNFSELDKGFYQIDNGEFKSFLEDEGFKLYDNFRSNYNSTLLSDMATFAMKHHYSNSGFNFTEVINAREVIVGSNPVINLFKKNGYKTHFIAEWPYLIANQPEIGYDFSNFSNKDVSLIGTGYSKAKEIFEPLIQSIEQDSLQPKFYFVQMFMPGHVPAQKEDTKGAKIEKELWIQRLDSANIALTRAVKIIKERDPNGLILIMADHGGYVGMDYTLQIRRKSEDRNWVYSIFSSQLAIRWPDNQAPEYDVKFKTPVNVFRILFSYLTENESYLNNLEEDASFLKIEIDAPKGVYKYIDESGNVIFKKI
ncbi:MAG: hypothetical protein KJO05_02735 [Bacteroidia bacterium]|nr:hypothetical protein [Bacteroidia bacterium]NNF32286.1 hypothetical protein [Flavobacteriaceae bacterium]MBT8276928.1 hypothetical protein [Bacteroidia bacterium]NNJ83291.1 hypothetical protein [Flavobacteriaceae bacterium]NNK53755.1 hypothetical protein [Flavobacteriaceae bacterium]